MARPDGVVRSKASVSETKPTSRSRSSWRVIHQDFHLRRDLDHSRSHSIRLSPARSGAADPFHSIRILPRRPSNSITHSVAPAGAATSSKKRGAAVAFFLLVFPDSANDLSLLNSSPKACDVGFTPCSRARLAAAAQSRLGIGARPRRVFLHRSNRRWTFLHFHGNFFLVGQIPPLTTRRRTVSIGRGVSHAGLPKAHPNESASFWSLPDRTPEVFRQWERLVIEQHVSGKKVHDARTW